MVDPKRIMQSDLERICDSSSGPFAVFDFESVGRELIICNRSYCLSINSTKLEKCIVELMESKQNGAGLSSCVPPNYLSSGAVRNIFTLIGSADQQNPRIAITNTLKLYVEGIGICKTAQIFFVERDYSKIELMSIARNTIEVEIYFGLHGINSGENLREEFMARTTSILSLVRSLENRKAAVSVCQYKTYELGMLDANRNGIDMAN